MAQASVNKDQQIGGVGNTAVGYGALMSNDTGSGNLALGAGALKGLRSGNFHVAIPVPEVVLDCAEADARHAAGQLGGGG